MQKKKSFGLLLSLILLAFLVSCGSGGSSSSSSSSSSGGEAGFSGDLPFSVVIDDRQATETGETASFKIKLLENPGMDVAVRLSSSDMTEGTISPTQLTFTTLNYNAFQQVTVTGIDDMVMDGDQTFEIQAVAIANGMEYEIPETIEVVNIDDESAGIRVSSISGDTTEEGATADFRVDLTCQPSSIVAIYLESENDAEGSISPDSLTFTSDNWNAKQTITVTGVDDDVKDGDQAYQILFSSVVSGDSNYDSMDVLPVDLINIDNESAGYIISEVDGFASEVGGQATFTVRLTSRPFHDVTIPVTTSDIGEGTVTPSELVFSDTNWNGLQTITVTGVDDDVADGNQSFSILLGAATSDDAFYDTLDPDDVELSNTDNDSAGFIVGASGDTAEPNGQATFTVVLTSQPTDDVTIPVTSSDTGEGTVTPSVLVFNDMNWNGLQTVTVTGVDDDIADGNQSYSIILGAVTSDDDNYDALVPDNVTLFNTDDDSAGIIVGASGNTAEPSGQATFTIVLTSQPTDDVTIPVTSSDTGEGTVTPSVLVFNDTNWNGLQTVTVTGVDDDIADGNQFYSIILGAVTSDDDNYDALDPDNVTLTNTDDDTAGFVVGACGNTAESSGQATFTVVLTSQPLDDVVIGLSSSDPGEGSVSPASLTFTDTDWDTPQTVTVTGQDDAIADGTQPYSISLAAAVSTDSEYNGNDPSDVFLSNTDNDSAGFTVSAISNNIKEDGTTATFTVSLTSEPTASVSIGVSSGDSGEAGVSPGTLIFNSGNWSSSQTVTVTGLSDGIDDGNQSLSVILAAAVSGDGNYSGQNPPDVSVINVAMESHFFLVSNTYFQGDFGGTNAAAAICLSDINTYTWKNKPSHTFSSSEVDAFLCDSSRCGTTKANKSYILGVINNTGVGGRVFTTDGSGRGPNNSYDWSNTDAMGNPGRRIWTGYATSGSDSYWIPTLASDNCLSWTTDSSYIYSGADAFPTTDDSRWSTGSSECNSFRLFYCLADYYR